MKDDQNFNINFVRIVERYNCIYEHTSKDYCNKIVQDQAWEMIGQEISEKPEDCKERWKNLRACYSRYMKSIGSADPGHRPKKPYYLAEYLTYLQPFTKFRQNKSQCNVQQTQEHSYEEGNDESEDMEDNSQTIEEHIKNGNEQTDNENTDIPVSRVKKVKTGLTSLELVNKCALEYFESKRTNSRGHENPDLSFFKSLLPDMKEMNSEQKRRFKVGVLNLAGEILNEEHFSPMSFASSTLDYKPEFT